MKHILRILLTTIIFMPVVEAKINKESFDKNYTQFLEQLKSVEKTTTDLEATGKAVYQQGLELFGEQTYETAILGEYYIQSMTNKFHNSDYRSVLDHIISIYEVREEELIRLTKTLVMKGELELNEDKERAARKLFNRAIELSRRVKDDELQAELNLEIGNHYGRLSKGSGRLIQKAIIKSEAAYSYYQKKESPLLANAAFNLGKQYLSLENYDRAIQFFRQAVNLFDEQEVENDNAMVAHSYLVQAYMENGDEDKATEHCLVVGQNQRWLDNAEIKPLYMSNPKFPRRAYDQGKSGKVTLKFAVNDEGYAENITVDKSEGSELFHQPSIEAVKKWRFAPKFENGKYVEGWATYTIEFLVE